MTDLKSNQDPGKSLSQTLAHYSILRVSGADSAKFLQGQLTCDLNEVSEQVAQIGGYCNVQGRLHGIFYALKQADDILLIMPQEVAEHLLQTLNKYGVFFQVELSIDNQLQLIATSGNPAVEALEQGFTINAIEQGCYLQFADSRFTRLYLVEQKSSKPLLEDFEPSEKSLLEVAQARLALPMIYSETIEKLLPHYVGLPRVGGINFEKGCYTGQEVVARMHYRGSLKTHPHLAKVNTTESIKPGNEVHNADSKKVGEVIYSVVDGEKSLALISLKDKAEQQELFVNKQLLLLEK